ncbi:MAG: NAD(P)/FAD-dependent oxidoreductase [Paracoccus sp. (in: a-proteobacteria)]|uniref:FAD-dependent oxidoreductase n=1 Tax=Paracoccus sp. TaxID=267 RepID=UPI0026DFB04E|nr:NAD(P)/FAD-dependent oxidoreductase [Paracoccus sp. (in: a-proteobacteria)]MDO5620956.1 NAD(P)/FAD-dependent oxidoreductase [Paracoccus sp. (in: a-proteobacteria)]
MAPTWREGKRVAVIGCGPGGVSTALALIRQGFDVRIYERQAEPKAIGGAVLLSVPVLAILRSYGIDVSNFGLPTVTHFKNRRGKDRVILPFNRLVEEKMGINGWHYGVLRSSAFRQMLELLPEGVILPGHDFARYEETDSGVTVHFQNGQSVQADMIVGADGIRSGVSRQMFGDPGLFHVGIRLWLAWCDHIEGVPPNYGFLSHDRRNQVSFFPMLHEGKPGFEWWVVEPARENDPVPDDPRAHVGAIVRDWFDPIPRLFDATDFDTQVFRWEIYNRPSLKTWSLGRAVCVGDAVHPVSPYAAYGMGMAIEDGYFLAKFLAGTDLRDAVAMTRAFARYEAQRVDYVNGNVEFARKLGRIFHNMPAPLAVLRDLVFDHTPFLRKMVTKDQLDAAERETLALSELHVG